MAAADSFSSDKMPSDEGASVQKIRIDGLEESTKGIAEKSESSWIVPSGVVPSLTLRRDITDEDRLEKKEVGTGSLAPRSCGHPEILSVDFVDLDVPAKR